MEEGRTKKVVRNTAYSIAYKLVDVVFAFILRTAFVRTLGLSYLGISGLFANVLSVLSLMELGIGGAIVFSLYRPLAEKNYPKVNALMRLYRRTYHAVAALIAVFGLTLTPVLRYIINLPTNIPYIYLIYWLSIVKSSTTYLLSYRRSLLLADQRSDINIKNLILFHAVRFIALLAILYLAHSYIIYLIADILVTIASDIHITWVVKRYYPFLGANAPELPKKEMRTIVKYIGAGVMSKVGQTVVTSTDNIIISAFLGTILVGVYANYSIIISNLEIVIYLLFNSFTASVGNYSVTNSREDSEALFRKVNFANYAVVFVCTVCLFNLILPFIKLWVGGEYLLSEFTVAILTLNFYIAASQKSVENFMGADGQLFYFNRYRSLIEGIVNLIVSIVLVHYTALGITGVFLGTTACFLCGRVWMDIYNLYKHWFKMPVKKYMYHYIKRFMLTACAVLAGRLLSKWLFGLLGITVLSWIFVGAVLALLAVAFFAAIFNRSDDFLFF